jgi:hypothetical protein
MVLPLLMLLLSAAGASYDNQLLRTAAANPELRTGFHFRPQKNWMNDPNGKHFLPKLNFSRLCRQSSGSSCR